MNLRSGRRLGLRPPLQQHGPSRRRDPGGADRISFLSDDMILLILERLHCIRTAVQTGLLSRRWRNLWTRITNLAFHGVAPAKIEAVFSRFNAASPAGTAFQLDIRLPSRSDAAEANSLLRAAAALFSPAMVSFAITPCLRGSRYNTNVIQVPCFQHATSIELDTQLFTIKPPAAGEFPALEKLSFSGATIQIGAWVTRCPRLRVLRAKFRGLDPGLLKQELGSLKAGLGTRVVAVFLDISISTYAPTVLPLSLSQVADFFPRELVYTNTISTQFWRHSQNLPCFHRATSIEITMPGFSFTRPLRGELSALERLRLFRCNVVNLGEFVSCCPRLRVLMVDGATYQRDITVHSTTLQELVLLGTYKDCRGIDIVTPKLKKLTMEVHGDGDLSTSVLAPLVEVSWRRTYTWQTPVFGFWVLSSLSIQTATPSNNERVLPVDGEDNTWLSVQQLPRAHALSMAMSATDCHFSYDLNFAREIEKLGVAGFWDVDIHLKAMGHVYGGTLLRLLQALPVHGVTKILKVDLLRLQTSEVTGVCKVNCFCDEPKENWRSQSISLPHLEEVEIKGFKGENHGFDFLKLILEGAPKLRKVTIKLAKRIKSFAPGSCAKIIYSTCLVYPSVDFYVYLGSGRLVPPP